MKTEEKKCYQQVVLEMIPFTGADLICTSGEPNDAAIDLSENPHYFY